MGKVIKKSPFVIHSEAAFFNLNNGQSRKTWAKSDILHILY